MGSQNLPPGRTLSDADVAAIAAKLNQSGVAPKQPVIKIANAAVEKELVSANVLLSKTYGSVGRIGKNGDTSSVHPPARPKKMDMRKNGSRQMNPTPVKITEPRVTSQVRSAMKPPKLSRVPLTGVTPTAAT